MTSNTPSLELMPFAQELDTAPVADRLGDTALSSFVAAGNAAEPEARGGDSYLDAAADEFAEGNVDRPLWDRAVTQAKGDRASAIRHYLHARASALRERKRDPRTEKRARASQVTGNTFAESAPPGSAGGGLSAEGEQRGAKLSASYGIALVATCAGIVWCVMLLYVYLGRIASQEPAVPVSVAPVNDTLPPVRAGSAAGTRQDLLDIGIQKLPGAELKARIDELRLAEDWNALLPYATEWTRREPDNAAAWSQLSLGFEQMKRYDDAHGAATKAAGLAPREPLYWRNLGELDRVLRLPEEALRAYAEAIALNDKDIHSLVQVGVLNLRLTRMAEARLALDRALAANPDDPDVACLKALVARQPIAAREFLDAAGRRESFTGNCRDFAEGKDAPVVASSSTTTQSAAEPRKR